PVNRQELVAFLYRLVRPPATDFPDPGFTDVPPGHPFQREIAWAAAVGIARGHPDGRFGALDPVDRASAAALFHRASRSPEGPFPAPGFDDVGPGHPFAHE